jgi:hypothetical protein
MLPLIEIFQLYFLGSIIGVFVGAYIINLLTKALKRRKDYKTALKVTAPSMIFFLVFGLVLIYFGLWSLEQNPFWMNLLHILSILGSFTIEVFLIKKYYKMDLLRSIKIFLVTCSICFLVVPLVTILVFLVLTFLWWIFFGSIYSL